MRDNAEEKKIRIQLLINFSKKVELDLLNISVPTFPGLVKQLQIRQKTEARDGRVGWRGRRG